MLAQLYGSTVVILILYSTPPHPQWHNCICPGRLLCARVHVCVPLRLFCATGRKNFFAVLTVVYLRMHIVHSRDAA